MEGIPEQHIEALPGATRKEAYEKVGFVWLGRSRGITSENQIAGMAKFGSAEAMHHQLKVWGFAGLLPPETAGEEPPKVKRPKAGQEHKARSSGQPEEVPDASAAAGLFKEALDQLRGQVELLEHLSLIYQGGYFTGAYTFEDHWPDFSTDGPLPSLHPTEASPYPPREVVALIAAYALVGRPIEPLLEVLYPEHSQADIKEIYELLYQTKSSKTDNGLLRTAQQFAAAVYGHKVERGTRGESPADDEALAWYITERREAGIKDEEIFQEILSSGRELSKKEFNRLANFRRGFSNT
jgi:hypothetical protein